MQSSPIEDNKNQQPKIEDIRTDKYGKKVYPLSDDEYKALKESISKKGFWKHEPIVINQHYDVLDGHHRFRACQELGKKPEFYVKEFYNELEEELFVIDCNLIRRQLNDYQRGVLILKKKPLLEELAKRNMSLAGKGDKILSPLGRVNKKIAEEFGRSYEQLRKIEILEQRAPEDMKKKLISGDKRVSPAYSELQRVEDRDKPKPAPPQGQYDVLYVDPPWTYEFSAVRGSAEDHYPVMTEEELMRLPLPAAKNAILFLWVPYPKSREAFDVIDAWGFVFKSKIVWVKDKIGTGHYVRAKHEELFICVKGEGLGLPAEQDRPESVVFAERREHSRKPEIFYELIQAMYPGRTRIELFARNNNNNNTTTKRQGWEFWGMEASKQYDDSFKM